MHVSTMVFLLTAKIEIVLTLINVIAVADEIIDTTTTTTTIAVPVPPKSIDISRIFISPGLGNTVKLDWGTPLPIQPDTTYWIYYEKDDDELTSPKLTTTNTSVLISDLEFCTKYKFAVSVAGDGNAHINQNNVRSIVTFANRTATPKDFRVGYEPREVPCMLVEWSASCPNVGQALGYVVSMRDYPKPTVRLSSKLCEVYIIRFAIV
ncbi:unnamed protein product [Acanthoscelides obtectus]|uniref:Fibronectin type-III domain-containing protein n=1 Tax=Acanthoscelides obtectus TaxID=200917 RepID=A0A9P0K1F8_ACAOB|nr:unnamed protein product [Acanthoscelides obtectus]CAK1639463.1 hypothetical protein AOBTE_LOCUS11189 [Acanthoscelides obtectus]